MSVYTSKYTYSIGGLYYMNYDSYTSLESYVEDCFETEITDAIESFISENGYICTDDPYASHAYLDNNDYIYCLTHESLSSEFDNLKVKSVRCKKLSKTEIDEINGTTYFIPLTCLLDQYSYVRNKDDLLVYDPYKGEADINHLISMEIRLSVDVVYTKIDENYDTIEVSRNNRRFIVTLLAELLNGLRIVAEIKTVESYDKSFEPVPIYETYLIPHISPEDLENKAEEIYNKYCSAHYKVNAQFPYEGILQDLGLTLLEVEFKKSNIFGRMYFKSAIIDDVTYSNKKYSSSNPLEVSSGTMLVSKEHHYMEDYGSLYNTIAHELIHWILHRDFFEIVYLLDTASAQSSCTVIPQNPSKKKSRVHKAIQLVEWQANNLASRIVMPKSWFIDALTLQTNKVPLNFSPYKGERLFLALINTADTFGVSKYDAKVRATQLGITEADGTMLSYEDNSFTSISYERESLGANQTYVLPPNHYEYMINHNRRFQFMIKKERYVYIDCFMVRNESPYIEKIPDGNSTKFALTEYARNHADECFLRFEKEYESINGIDCTYYGQCYLSRALDDSVFVKYNTSTYDLKNQDTPKRKDIGIKLMEECEYLTHELTELPGKLSKTLEAHMKRGIFNNNKEITIEELAKRSKLCKRAINEILEDEDHTSHPGSIFAICVALGLPPIFSQDMLRKAGITFRNTKKDYFQRIMLEMFYTESVEAINEVLEENGITRWVSNKDY